jgi:hypothetical protein
VADWFNTQTDPEIARAVADAVADARSSDVSAITAALPLPEPMQYPPLSQQDQQSSAPRHGSY